MRVLVASLGFAWHHVLAVANRCEPDAILLATVDINNERVRNAIGEIELHAKSMRRGARVEAIPLNVEDLWRCARDALDLFGRGDEYCLGLGGGIRALSLCLFVAGFLAVQLADVKLIRVYTMAENLERVVEMDLGPVLFVRSIADSRASTKRDILRKLGEGEEIAPGRYGRNVLKQFEEHGLLREGRATDALFALSKALELGDARRGRARRRRRAVE